MRLTLLGTTVCRSVDKKKVHLDCWLLKKFAVMMKRKLFRGQRPRNKEFLELLAILTGGEFDVEEDRCQFLSIPVVFVIGPR